MSLKYYFFLIEWIKFKDNLPGGVVASSTSSKSGYFAAMIEWIEEKAQRKHNVEEIFRTQLRNICDTYRNRNNLYDEVLKCVLFIHPYMSTWCPLCLWSVSWLTSGLSNQRTAVGKWAGRFTLIGQLVVSESERQSRVTVCCVVDICDVMIDTPTGHTLTCLVWER